MFTQIATIARNTFTESIRQPVFIVLLGLGTIVQVLAMTAAYTLEDDNKLMIDMGMSTIFVVGLLLAAFIATGVLAREIENKTVLTVVSKPVSRVAFVLGKYFGVTGAIGVAVWVWSMVFLLGVRHKVMSTAADHYDMPVILFALAAFAVAILVAVWGNYFYGWVFSANAAGFLAAGLTLAYLLVLVVSKDWTFQPITTEFTQNDGKLVQIVTALFLIFEGLAVVCAVAIACSTRLGQVMTLLICLGTYFAGLISDWALGGAAQANVAARAGYAAVFNMGFVWMADALTQNHPVSGYYVAIVTAYSAFYIGAVLCLAVALFQTREAG